MNPQDLLALLQAQGQQQQDPMSSTQQSMVGSIQALNELLTRRQQQENALPQNAPIQQANTGINEQAAQFISQLLNQPKPFTANDHLFNENVGRQLGQAQGDALAAKARMDKYGGGDWRSAQKLANAMGAAGEAQAMMGNAPGELQQKQNTAAMQPLMQALGLSGALPKDQINNPQLLAMLGKNAGDVGAAEATSQGYIGSAQAKAAGDVAAANATAAGGIEQQKIASQGLMDTELAKSGVAADKLSKGARSKLESSIAEHTNTLTSVGDLGKKFDPNYFTTGNAIKEYALANAEKLGIPVGEAQEKFLAERATFIAGLEGVFNQYRKAITGAAASVQEIERLRKAMLNPNNSPSQAKALMVKLMTDMETDVLIAKQILQNGIAPGVEPGTKEFGVEVAKHLAAPQGQKIRELVQADIIQRHPQLNFGDGSDIASNAVPANNGNETPEEAMQKLIAAGIDPQTGQPRKQ